MKCPRCKHDMIRRKVTKGYEYYCPVCKKVVRANTQTNTDRESVADNSTTSGDSVE